MNMNTPRSTTRLDRRAPAFLLTAVLITACGPKSTPATGPIADQVAQSIESGTQSFDNSDFSALLDAGVRDGLVDYAFFQDNRDKLDAYLRSVAAANLANLDPNHLQALLYNAYNAYTITSILDHWPVKSIRDIKGVWDTATHEVGGLDLTLDNIEHNILRPMFKDPRVHVAVNCASQSCAALPNWAFDGDQLEQQLDSWTRQFFATSKYLELDGDRLLVSKLLDWYGDDFTAPEARPRADTLAAFIAQYAPKAVADFIAEEEGEPEIAFKAYDWSLNQAP